MAQKTKDQFTVVCEGLFLNDTKPTEWKQNFPWTASVGLHYRTLDESGEPIGEPVKKYLKHLWLFQAMGGKNAKGHFFRLEAESGMLPAKDGQPEKPYTSITPIAEVFADGTARFLEAPKDGKVTVPNGAKPATPPVAKTAQPPKATPSANGNGFPWAKDYMKKISIPQSDEWWANKEAFNLDGAIISNSYQYAAVFCSTMKWNDKDTNEDIMQTISEWANRFENAMRLEKAERCRARLVKHLGLCTARSQVFEKVKVAWTMLPPDHFEMFRETARIRALQLPKEGEGEILETLPTPEVEAENQIEEEPLEEEIPL